MLYNVDTAFLKKADTAFRHPGKTTNVASFDGHVDVNNYEGLLNNTSVWNLKD
jgi:prepilin-type processing-associated H-X9-DG protein